MNGIKFMIFSVFVVTLNYVQLGKLEMIPCPDYAYNFEIAESYVDYMSTMLLTLEEKWQTLLGDVESATIIETEILELKKDIAAASAPRKYTCVVKDRLQQYEDGVFKNMQQCASEVVLESYNQLKNNISMLTSKVQTLDALTKKTYNQCNGEANCQNKVLTNAFKKFENLKNDNKAIVDGLFQLSLASVPLSLNLCVITKSADLFLQIKQSRFDIESCLRTGK